MDEWKAAAIVVGSYHFMNLVLKYDDRVPPEFKVAASLIGETVEHGEYESALEVIKQITNDILYDDCDEAQRLKEYLGLKTVN